MRTSVCAATLVVLIAWVGLADAAGRTYVRGHVRRDGSYVPPHYRTNPDASFYNNWSSRGNVNPYTGKPGTKDFPTPTYYSRSDGRIAGLRVAPIPRSLDAGAVARSVSRDAFPIPELTSAIPTAVADRISQYALRQWPNDYSMQAFIIEKQRAGYQELVTYIAAYSTLQLPVNVTEWALATARNQWPMDYSMQAFSFDKNVDGYMRLCALLSSEEWNAIPEDLGAWLLEAAYASWANDFSMQAFVVEQQMDGFYRLCQIDRDLEALPRDVAQQIRSKARQQWPRDLGMQAFVMERERDGYRKLNVGG